MNLVKYFNDIRIADKTPLELRKNLPLKATICLSQVASILEVEWFPTGEGAFQVDLRDAWQEVQNAFRYVLLFHAAHADLDEISKTIPTWKQLAIEGVEGPPRALIADALLDCIATIIDVENTYKAFACFGILCACFDKEPEELLPCGY